MTLPPSPFAREHFLALGHSRRDLDRLVEAGEVVRLRRGWYARPTRGEALAGWAARVDRHLEQLVSELASRPGHVASHTTAALLQGLAVTVAPETPVHLTTVDRVGASRRYPGLRIHRSESVVNDTEVVEGVRCTRVVRTVADVLRTRSLPHGLALLDDALRRGLVDLGEVRQLVDQQHRWRGRPKALAAIHLADPARESWGESFSFAHLHLQGQPMPLPQVEILDAGGDFLGRVDGLWPERGVVAECDGDMKYFIDDDGLDASAEATVLRRLDAEQERQTRLEATGLGVARWSPAQVRDDPGAVSRRVNQLAAGLDPAAFTGWVRWGGALLRLPFSVDRPGVHPETLRYRRSPRRRAA